MSKKMSLSESCRVILSSGKDAVDNLFKNKKQKPIKRSVENTISIHFFNIRHTKYGCKNSAQIKTSR